MSFSYVTEMFDDLSAENLELVVRSSIQKINDNKKSRSGARLSRNLLIATVIRKAKLVMVNSQKILSPQRMEDEADSDMDVQCDNDTLLETPVEHIPRDSISDTTELDETPSLPTEDLSNPPPTPSVLSVPVPRRKRRSCEMDDSDCDSLEHQDPVVTQSKSQRLSDTHVPTVPMEVDSSQNPLPAQILPGPLNLPTVTPGQTFPGLSSLQGTIYVARLGSTKDGRPQTVVLVPYTSLTFPPNFQQLYCLKASDLACNAPVNSHLKSVDIPLIHASS